MSMDEIARNAAREILSLARARLGRKLTRREEERLSRPRPLEELETMLDFIGDRTNSEKEIESYISSTR